MPTFDWTINFGNILTIVAMVGCVVAAWFKMERRLGNVENEQNRASEERKEIVHKLEKLSDQVARLEGTISARQK